MKKYIKVLVVLLASGCIFCGGLAHADQTESGKLVGQLLTTSDGGITVTVQSPTVSATSCLFSLLNIAASSPARNNWLSVLLAAKTAQMLVIISFNTSCTITNINLP